jgi:pyrimidine-specific ribonucleoside hydrolase
MEHKLPFHFDMETADPDDSMTLAVLATHPKVHLVSVSVHPGGTDQIGVVRRILQILDREDVRIGAGTPKSIASRVSGFHRDGLESLNIQKQMIPQPTSWQRLFASFQIAHC